MGEVLHFATLREVNAARSKRWMLGDNTLWSPAEWMVACGGEAGEALDVVKKTSRERLGLPGNDHGLGRVEALTMYAGALGRELADGVIYLDLNLSVEGLGPLGADNGLTDFNALRNLSVTQYKPFVDKPIAFWGRRLMVAMGQLAQASENLENSDPFYRAQQRASFSSMATLALVALDCIALKAEINLAYAVVDTFNRKSSEKGFEERLMLLDGMTPPPAEAAE